MAKALLLLMLLTPTTDYTVSWYECCNSKTAAGIKFNPEMDGVAHKSLPFGTMVLLSYNGNTVVVPVIDRGPYIKGREFDLTRGTARKLGILKKGVAKVKGKIL